MSQCGAGAHTCGYVGVCPPPPVHRPLALNTFHRARKKKKKAVRGPGDARRPSVCVNLRHHSIQPVLSLVVIDGACPPFKSGLETLLDTKYSPPPSRMQIHHHHDKCHHLCHFNSLICLGPRLHLSSCFNRATPGL